MHLELIRAQSRRSQAGLRSHIALTTLTLVHRALLLAIATLRPNDISVAYLFLFLVAHQRASFSSAAAFLQLAAAAIVAAAALLQEAMPEASHAPCATGVAAWVPDVAVLVESCALLAFATYTRYTRRSSDYALLCAAAPRHAVGPWAHAASGCVTHLSGTVAPLVLGSLAAASQRLGSLARHRCPSCTSRPQLGLLAAAHSRGQPQQPGVSDAAACQGLRQTQRRGLPTFKR